MLKVCAKCGEAGSLEDMRSTLFDQFLVHKEPCVHPSERESETVREAKKLLENFWEGRYYSGVPDEERYRMAGEDLAKMLERVLEVTK